MSKKDAAVSASTVGTTVITAAGCHVLRIRGYSQTKLLGTGAGANSCEFEAAGQFWRISYYPNGDYFTSDRDSISLSIDLISSEHNWSTGYVNAIARFTLLPHHGKQPAKLPQPHSVRLSGKFSANSERCFRFIKREELERSEGYLVDDCFAVRCDIDVVKTWARCDRAQDVVETTAAGLAWRSGAEDGGCTSTATDRQTRREAAAAWLFAALGVVFVCMILYQAYVI